MICPSSHKYMNKYIDFKNNSVAIAGNGCIDKCIVFSAVLWSQQGEILLKRWRP